MPLEMRKSVFITAAITGSGSTQDRSHLVPRSPKQIAEAAIDAAKAGAAVVHCHVRDPETGAPSRNFSYYREVTVHLWERKFTKTDHILIGTFFQCSETTEHTYVLLMTK